MLIQKQQNITFQKHIITPEAKPFLRNSLPGAIGYDENLTSIDVSQVLLAFKKRMQKIAGTLEKKKGLDIVLELQQNKPVYTLKTKNGDKIGESLHLTEFHPKPDDKGINFVTINDSKNDFDSVLNKTYSWIDGLFPQTVKKPTEIKLTEIYKPDKNSFLPKIITKRTPQKAPKTLTEAVDKVFG